MAISVEKIQLWRGEVEDRPGALVPVLDGAAAADVIMGYSYPGPDRRNAILEIYPVANPSGGLARSSKPTLLIRGEGRAGLSEAFYRAIADAGINMDFLVAQAVGDSFSVVVGFSTDDDADRAAAIARAYTRTYS